MFVVVFCIEDKEYNRTEQNNVLFSLVKKQIFVQWNAFWFCVSKNMLYENYTKNVPFTCIQKYIEIWYKHLWKVLQYTCEIQKYKNSTIELISEIDIHD